MMAVPPVIVERMRTALRAQTDECLQECFGISWNTWVKVRSGQPIRYSTAQRLIGRLEVSEPRHTATRADAARGSSRSAGGASLAH